MPIKKNFDFAKLPAQYGNFKLQDIGMHASTIEVVDQSLVSWVKEDLRPVASTNKGLSPVPVLWVTPERAFQIKNKKQLRDETGNLKLPLITIERTNITKDPARKGGFQAHLFSDKKNGRSGRFVIAKRIKQDKTREFLVNDAVRPANQTGGTIQEHYPHKNLKKLVIQIVSIPIPVYINANYKITIETEYQSQMNELVTPFITRPGQINSFLLNRNGHRYEAFVESDFSQSNNTANMGEDNRKFITEITIRVLGYLIGDGEDRDRPIVRIDENVVELRQPQERVLAGDYDESIDKEREFPRDYGILSKS
tara:strand:+ start:1120 stop:2049 length:930 start_codon:yes stop_codon:yes gene_type:complete